MSDKIINVLYVDDEENNLISFKANFKKYFNIYFAINAIEAEIILNQQLIHVLITDQKMPIKLGTELLEESVKKYPEQTRILLTAFASSVEIREAFKKGHIFIILDKPWNDVQLIEAIKLGYEVYNLQVEKKQIKTEIDKLDSEQSKV